MNKQFYLAIAKKGLSIKNLSKKMNVSSQTIYQWKLGQTKPSIENIKRLSTLIDVSVEELMRWFYKI
jgi:transcriptional regulator with XRE-family HTH domain